MGDAHGSITPGVHSALSGYTGFLLSRTGMIAMKRFSARLEPLGLTTRLWGVLNVLEAESGIRQHQLGTSVGMDPSSMVSAIDELEKQGRVERRRDPADRRAHALYLTDEGRATLAQGRKIAAEAHEDLLAPLSPDERAQLHDLLLRLATAASGVPAPECTPPAKAGVVGEP
jgi:DNA-binding MarR family transcriptional regulator